MSNEVATSEVAHKESRRPYPVITPDSEPFWASVHERALRLPKCRSCTTYFFPPAPFCPNCWSDEISWETVAGTGKIFSFVTFQRLYDPSFADLLPYSVAVIEFDEGPRMLSRITGTTAPEIDARVEVVYEDLDGDTTLPLFRVIAPAM